LGHSCATKYGLKLDFLFLFLSLRRPLAAERGNLAVPAPRHVIAKFIIYLQA